MNGTFGGLSTALSSLYTQRRALEVTGQNVANANTEGYSRQRVEMEAAGGAPVPAIHSVSNGAGAGVLVADVARLRDAFLEARGRAEHAQSTYLTAHKDIYARIENVFAEPSDTALSAQMHDFWAGWSEVGSHPENEAVRTQLIERASVVADGMRAAYDALDAQWGSSRKELDAYVTEVNATADAVALLNRTIQQQKAAGLPANELADQRDLHLMRLAELTGATTVAREDHTIDVYVGGSALVAGGSARHLAVTGTTTMTAAAGDPVGVQWASGTPATITGGQVAASLDVLGSVIPDYVARLDEVAVALADQVNAVHRVGYGLDAADAADTAGDFFVADPAGQPMSARTISVAVTNPRDLGVSTVFGTLDGTNADNIAALARLADGADAKYSAMVVGLGVAAQTATRRAEIQASVAADMDTLRSADAGVNLDEEMTNMIAFQRAYEAASRMLTSIDEMLDVLINRTGLVGR